MSCPEFLKKALLQADCAVFHGESCVYSAKGRGIGPLLKAYEAEGEPLNGALVADKIVGKAAAMLLISGKALAVYAEVMSEKAYELLCHNNIRVEYNTLSPFIKNRQNDGPCPIEAAVKSIEAPEDGYKAIKNTLAELKIG